NDATWTAGMTGVGYETETPGAPTGSGFSVRMVDTNGGTDGDFSNIGEAAAVLDGTAAAGAFVVATDTTATRSAINLGDGASFASGARTTFSAATFSLLADGVLGWSVKDPTSLPPPNYRNLISTDLQSAMFNKANTAYIRTSFTVKDPGDFDEARFQMRYDDG